MTRILNFEGIFDQWFTTKASERVVDTHLDALDAEDLFEQVDGRLVLGIDLANESTSAERE